jgi:hypothetical protein
MKIVPNKILSALVAISCSIPAVAIPNGPGNGPPAPGLPPPGLPIDAGIVVLAAAAVMFGLFKIYQFKLHKKTPM